MDHLFSNQIKQNVLLFYTICILKIDPDQTQNHHKKLFNKLIGDAKGKLNYSCTTLNHDRELT